MITFHPYSDFRQSAAVLDRQRLGKQRIECLQMVRALVGETLGWRNHPSTRLWRGYTQALVRYGIAMCDEWQQRGYRDATQDKLLQYRKPGAYALPRWLFDEQFLSGMRARLLDKGICDETFERVKKLDTKRWFPKRKRDWSRKHYERAWRKYGKPPVEETWYGQFGWREEPSETYHWPRRVI